MTNQELINNYIEYNTKPSHLDRGEINSLFYRGPDLYSYATKMARFVEGGCIINPRQYSVTTSKQMSLLRYSLIRAAIPFSYLVEE